MLDRLLAPIAPHSCCGCGLVGHVLCPSCKNDIVSELFSRCVECLKPTAHSGLCSLCEGRSVLSDAWCVGVHDGALKQLLATYKFYAARVASDTCVELLLETLPVLPSDAVVVPVPTASAHRRVRGFDHMAVISRAVARRRNVGHAQLLRRIDNETQHLKTRRERLLVTPDNFEIVRQVPQVILLIDDVYTTGATLLSCAKLLRDNGAKQVFGAVIARQILDEGHDL